MIGDGADDRGSARALTSSRYATERPRSLIQWAETFLEKSPAPVAVIELAGYRLLYANAAFRRLHTLPTDARELTVSELLDPAAARELELLIDRGVTSGTLAQEGTITPRHGEQSLHCSVWALDHAEVGEVSLVMTEMHRVTDADTIRAFQVDVTQRLLLSALHEQMVADAAGAAEKVAEMANAAKDRFLTTMSHELRTPLNAIGGYAELIELGLRGPVTAEQRHDLSRIQRAQEHLLGLINAVLNYSKLGSGSIRFEMTAVALGPILESVREMLMTHLSRQGLVYNDLINESASGEPPLVRADPEKLSQILINLLTNAIKFTRPGGTISASHSVHEKTVSVHINDTGRGIPDDQLSTIFDPFVQVGRRLNSNDQGVGLGLSISRDLARAMGGDLTVISTLGVGSRFTLTLDRASTDAPPSP